MTGVVVLTVFGWGSNHAQDAAPADRNAVKTAARPGGMMADSPVTFPKEGALPAKFPPDLKEHSEPAEEDYYIFSSPCRSLEQIRAIEKAMPRGEFTIPKPDWTHLRRTRRILTEGGDLRLLALGDSIVNDTMRSGWVALLQEAFPKAHIQATVYVRGGGGCQHYREETRVEKYILPKKPDLVYIGGISQRDIESIRDVIRQLRAGLPDVEILLATGTFGTVDPRDPVAIAGAPHSGTGAYGRALRALATEQRCGYLDMTGPWAEYIRSTKLHPHLFYRDMVHANEFGEQILAKIMMAFFCSSPANADAPTGQPPHPMRVIFDTDMGSDCDDAGALAILHVYADRGLVDIIGCIFSSGKVPYGAAVVDAINVYYGRLNIPVGAAHDDTVGDPVDKMAAEKLARDQAAFGNRIVHNLDAEEMTALNRRLLAAQPDQSVTYLTVGHTKGLHDLLVSKPDVHCPLSGRDLVKRKLRRWVALGALGANNPERRFTKDWNFFFNGTAPYTKHLVENIPVPAFYVDGGEDVLTGKGLKATPPGNIVRTAYRDWLWNYEKKPLDGQRPSWDMVAVLYAVEGIGEFLVDEGQGWLEFDLEKGCRWNRGKHGPAQTFIRQKPGVSTQLADYLNALLATKPAKSP